MFKTIQQCRLDLVAHTAAVPVVGTGSAPGDTISKRWKTPDVDFLPASAARVSFGKEDKTGQDPEADRKLMKYLADHEHMTPFEHQSATFLVEVPLFIRSQIMRHRTFAYNEISRRYTDENLEFWIPDVFRGQAANNRQASDGTLDHTNFTSYLGWQKNKLDIPIPMGTSNGNDGFEMWRWSCYNAWHTYLGMLENGVCREQARAILPQSLLTKFYMTGNLRNWAHFIRLRKDAHAQKEVQVVAERIEAELRKLWPTAVGVLLGEEVAIDKEAVKT